MTEVSRSNAPASICCSVATAVNNFVIDAVSNRVCKRARHSPRVAGEAVGLREPWPTGTIDAHDAGERPGVGEHGELGIERHRIHAERRYRCTVGVDQTWCVLPARCLRRIRRRRRVRCRRFPAMRAALCTEFGPPESLVVREVDDPVPGAGQVVVDMHACGVNFPDYLMIQDLYQFKPELPFSPGGEISGVVSAVGPGVDRLAVGDRVVCSVGFGGMAERVVVPEASAIEVPDGVDMTAAAAFLVAHGTSHYALKDRGNLQAGETLLVLGAAGGVGLSAVELGALGRRTCDRRRLDRREARAVPRVRRHPT